MTNYQWGIIGLGDIATQFVEDFSSQNSSIRGVSARNFEKVQAFANRFAIDKAYESPQEMLADPAIDIVYIAVPNEVHQQYILAALNAGKHVLCEKAITTNLKDLEAAIALAEEKNLVLKEAMTIFNMPLFSELQKIIASQKLGKLKMVQAPFGSYKAPDPKNRFFNPDLGGGALLDIGTYAVSFARFFMSQTPVVTFSSMLPFQTGVDEQSITILQNEADEMASVTLTFQAKMPKVGIAAFENGYISVPEYPRADQATIVYRDGTTESIESGSSDKALSYEVEKMIQTINGQPNHSLSLTRDVIAILDQIQQIWQNAK